MKKMRTYGTGILIGLLNGLFGAGGGIVAVTAFEKMGMPDKSSHATAVAVMIFLSAVSGFLYWYNGHVSFADVLPYLPGGIAGSVFGGWLLPKIPEFLAEESFFSFYFVCCCSIIFEIRRRALAYCPYFDL